MHQHFLHFVFVKAIKFQAEKTQNSNNEIIEMGKTFLLLILLPLFRSPFKSISFVNFYITFLSSAALLLLWALPLCMCLSIHNMFSDSIPPSKIFFLPPLTPTRVQSRRSQHMAMKSICLPGAATQCVLLRKQACREQTGRGNR